MNLIALRVKAATSILALGTCLLLCGCAQNYVIVTSNGSRITTTSKPRLKDGSYVYTDAKGRKVSIPALRVREVSPASMASDDSGLFKGAPSR